MTEALLLKKVQFFLRIKLGKDSAIKVSLSGEFSVSLYQG
jgi:hypothetical protein